ncbi:MAG: response regulator [Pseudonocardiaceae bacterium]
MINLLVVEDDQVAAEAHRLYVQRVPGFEVAGVVHSGHEALRLCQRVVIDVILLDFYLPDIHGLNVCRKLRAAGSTIDVIAVTAARGVADVRTAKSLGVVHYLIKPFDFASLRGKLESYAEFRQRAAGSGQVVGQGEVDDIVDGPRRRTYRILPPGMSGETLQKIIDELTTVAADGLSAAAAAEATGMSAMTARRYLGYLADNGLAERSLRYGRVGRPEIWFFLMP